MLHEKAGDRGTRNRGRHQVAQSWLNRLYFIKKTGEAWNKKCEAPVSRVNGFAISKKRVALRSQKIVYKNNK